MTRGVPFLYARSFALLNATQFLTVLNDNVFKQTIVLIALQAQGSQGNGHALAQFLFSLPFLLFALYAGDLADRWPKRDMVVAAKAAEVLVMLMGAVALATGSLTFGLAVLFLMAAQSAFLGPAKYGALPEYAGPAALARANGWFQGSMMAAIVLGTGVAGFLLDRVGMPLWGIPILLAAVAAIGTALAWPLQRLPAAEPGRRAEFAPLRRLSRGWRDAGSRPGLRAALLGHALFWFVSSLAYVAWNELIATRPDGSQLVAATRLDWSLGLAAMGGAMGAGAVLCGLVARGPGSRGLLLFGGAALAVGLGLAGCVPAQPASVLACGLAGALGSGFLVIPLRTRIQNLAPPERLGAVLGTSQTLDFAGIALGALARVGLRPFGADARDVLVTCGVLLLIGLALLARGFSAGPATGAPKSA